VERIVDSCSNKFDLTDVESNDTLSEILEVAGEVIGDYGPGTTRIQRLATWLAENLGGERPKIPIGAMISNQPAEPSKTVPRKMTSDEARDFAAAVLHGADEAETEH
jgi:hypothetical protein